MDQIKVLSLSERVTSTGVITNGVTLRVAEGIKVRCSMERAREKEKKRKREKQKEQTKGESIFSSFFSFCAPVKLLWKETSELRSMAHCLVISRELL